MTPTTLTERPASAAVHQSEALESLTVQEGYLPPAQGFLGSHVDSDSAPRTMLAITVALSEPTDGIPVDWPRTIAANLRLMYANTTVEVLDAWRADA